MQFRKIENGGAFPSTIVSVMCALSGCFPVKLDAMNKCQKGVALPGNDATASWLDFWLKFCLKTVVTNKGGQKSKSWKSYAIQCQLRCGITKSATRGTCGWYKTVFLDFASALYHHHIKEYVILFTNRRAPLWLVDQQKYPANTGRRNWFNHVQFQWFFDFSDVKKTLQLLPWWVGPLSQGLALTFAEFVWNRRVSLCVPYVDSLPSMFFWFCLGLTRQVRCDASCTSTFLHHFTSHHDFIIV